MKEGAWLNAKTSEWFWVEEHSTWIQDPRNARALGVPECTLARIKDIQTDYFGEARKRILLNVLCSGPFARIRGHGQAVTFEFMCATADALSAFRMFCKENLGRSNILRLSNLRSKESTELLANEFTNTTDQDVLRLAKRMPDGCFSSFVEECIKHG